MARVRVPTVPTSVLRATDPTHGRWASAHARSARIYGSPDDPIFLEGVRHAPKNFCNGMVSFWFVLFFSTVLNRIKTTRNRANYLLETASLPGEFSQEGAGAGVEEQGRFPNANLSPEKTELLAFPRPGEP